MYRSITISDLETRIKDCESRISFYEKSLVEHPDDKMFEASLRRAEANKKALEAELELAKREGF